MDRMSSSLRVVWSWLSLTFMTSLLRCPKSLLVGRRSTSWQVCSWSPSATLVAYEQNLLSDKCWSCCLRSISPYNWRGPIIETQLWSKFGGENLVYAHDPFPVMFCTRSWTPQTFQIVDRCYCWAGTCWSLCIFVPWIVRMGNPSSKQGHWQ